MAEKKVRLTVTAELLEREAGAVHPEGAAYAFSSGGRLLARERLGEKGTALLVFAAVAEATGVRVVVGPDLPGDEIRVSELRRRGAVERRLRIDPDTLSLSAKFAVPPADWRCWLLGRCWVKGTLRKRVESGGVTLDLPVCHATVEVYEVDPLRVILPRLPDLEIERLRDLLVHPPPWPPPIGPLPPGPVGPFPPGPDPGPEHLRLMRTPATEGAGLSADAGSLPTPAADAELRTLALTASTFQLRQALIDRPLLVRPFLCRYFPAAVRMQQVATATTDECGRFRASFFRGCLDPDTPDLYFRATQRLLPAPFPPIRIYGPTPIACYTHWNYACGTEVSLVTRDSGAIACSPCPDVAPPPGTAAWVLVMAVGNHPLSLIRGTSAELEPTTDAGNRGLTGGGAPWGGLLRLRLEFDNRLRDTLGVRYYRVGWHQGTNPADSFHDLTAAEGAVQRHYAHMVGSDLVIDPYDLGPVQAGSTLNLFKIPPALPPIGQWSIPDAVEDTTSAKFRTTVWVPAPQQGKYQLKVDLFDAGGNPVDIGALGIKYLVPESTDLSGTIATVDASALGLVSGNSFIMTVHVDNRVCTAAIAPPTLLGVPAGNDCGVLEYTPGQLASNVEMPYTAAHPGGFATYSFSLYRGAGLLVPPSVGGAPVGAGAFAAAASVSQLLGACTVAGFSENVYVAAMATDGWNRLSGYDAAAVRAFVLARPGHGGGP